MLKKIILTQQKGFSLIELLVTISILAAVAGIGTSIYLPSINTASTKVAKAEIVEIIKAIKQFKKDTGYYPKQGPFALSGSGIGLVDINSIPIMDTGDPTASNVKTYWFNSPANFWQLYVAPIKEKNVTPIPDVEVMPWSADTGRGWKGPYLQNRRELVDMGNSLSIQDVNNPLQSPTPEYGITVGALLNSGSLKNIYGIADPFINDAVVVVNEVDTDRLLLDWHMLHTLSTDYLPKEHDQTRYGRPFLLMYKNGQPRLISMGPDGEYGGVNGGDECVKGNKDTDVDDMVICFN